MRKVKYVTCPVFEAIGKLAQQNECRVCPFAKNCLEDIQNDATAKILRIVGDYIREERKKAGLS